MPEKNPLDDLMEKFSSELKYKVPLGLIANKEERHSPFDGVEIALVYYWSYRHALLQENIVKVLDKLIDPNRKLTHKTLIGYMVDSVGDVLESHIYQTESKEFVVDYVAFTFQWQYNFYEDLEKLYPHMRSFGELPQTKEAYDAVFDLLDKRYAMYFDTQNNQNENNVDDKTPQPSLDNQDNIIPDDFFVQE